MVTKNGKRKGKGKGKTKSNTRQSVSASKLIVEELPNEIPVPEPTVQSLSVSMGQKVRECLHHLKYAFYIHVRNVVNV